MPTAMVVTYYVGGDKMSQAQSPQKNQAVANAYPLFSIDVSG